MKRFTLSKIAVAVAVALGIHAERRGLALGALAPTLDKDAWAKLAKEVQALYVEKDGKYHLDVEGGIDDKAELKSALDKERKAAREAERLLKEFQKKFEGIDADEVKKLLEKLGGDEEAMLIKAGKIDEVIARRTEKLVKAHEKALKDATDKTIAEKARADKFSQRVLDNHIRAAATKAGLHANAVEDALFRARTMFSLNEEGEAVQLDKDGHVVSGKDGRSPYSPTEWLEGMKETAPHWFPAGGTGGGAPGGKGGAAGKTMKRADFEALDPVAKHKAVMVDKVTVVN